MRGCYLLFIIFTMFFKSEGLSPKSQLHHSFINNLKCHIEQQLVQTSLERDLTQVMSYQQTSDFEKGVNFLRAFLSLDEKLERALLKDKMFKYVEKGSNRKVFLFKQGSLSAIVKIIRFSPLWIGPVDDCFLEEIQKFLSGSQERLQEQILIDGFKSMISKIKESTIPEVTLGFIKQYILKKALYVSKRLKSTVKNLENEQFLYDLLKEKTPHIVHFSETMLIHQMPCNFSENLARYLDQEVSIGSYGIRYHDRVAVFEYFILQFLKAIIQLEDLNVHIQDAHLCNFSLRYPENSSKKALDFNNPETFIVGFDIEMWKFYKQEQYLNQLTNLPSFFVYIYHLYTLVLSYPLYKLCEVNRLCLTPRQGRKKEETISSLFRSYEEKFKNLQGQVDFFLKKSSKNVNPTSVVQIKEITESILDIWRLCYEENTSYRHWIQKMHDQIFKKYKKQDFLRESDVSPFYFQVKKIKKLSYKGSDILICA